MLLEVIARVGLNKILLSNGEWMTEDANTQENYDYQDSRRICCVDDGEKFFILWHQVGNFAVPVLASTIFDEVQDELVFEWLESVKEGDYEGTEEEEELFYSYYSIQEVNGND